MTDILVLFCGAEASIGIEVVVRHANFADRNTSIIISIHLLNKLFDHYLRWLSKFKSYFKIIQVIQLEIDVCHSF